MTRTAESRRGPYLGRRAANSAATLMLAAFKAALVALFFMHVRDSPRLTSAVVIGSLFWLFILLALTMSDYLTRGWMTRG